MDILVLSVLCLAVLADLATYKIPNALTLTTLAGTFLLSLLFSGPPGLVHSVSLAAMAMAILFPFYLIKALGAGDIKLFMIISAASSMHIFLAILLSTLLLSAVYGIFKKLYTFLIQKKRGRCHIHYSPWILGAYSLYLMGLLV